MECPKVTPCVRKSKKKQVKDELDRIKQAEKKKRRLEKALATSAAIRSELEKKKLKKKEEQDRLDEEGAAIAESVALHVLLGEDEVSMQSNIDIFVGPARPIPARSYHDFPSYSIGKNMGYVSNAHSYGRVGNYHYGNSNLMVSSDPGIGHFYPRSFGDEGWGSVAGHLAAQAVSSLKIADDARVDAYVFNRMLRG